MSSKSSSKWQVPSHSKRNVQKLLSSLQNHILSYYTTSFQHDKVDIGQGDLLTTHLSHLFRVATDILKRAVSIVSKYPLCLELLYNILLESVTGGMLFKILTSLLLMPTTYLTKIHHFIQDLMEPLDMFTQFLPTDLLGNIEKDSSSKFYT